MSLKPDELRTKSPSQEELAQIKRRPFVFILDNVLDTYNVGGLFRLADAIAAEKVYLCGATQTPPSSRIHKSAVGTENWVPWEYFHNPIEAINKIKSQNPDYKFIALEQHPKALPLTKLNTPLPVAVIVGHETAGVSPEVINKCDHIIELPLFGINHSLNVVVASGILSYHILMSKLN